MKVIPKNGVLLIKKHHNTSINVDIVVEESDDDKRLITGEIISVSENETEYKPGQSVVFGKYALFELNLKGESIYFLTNRDVVGLTDYKEN